MTKKKTLVLRIFGTWFGLASIAFANQTPVSIQNANPPSKQTTKIEPAKILWDHWYTVTILPNTPYAYYNEKVTENAEDRIAIMTEMRKIDEGFINQENLGAIAMNTNFLEPLFFNYRSIYRTTETRIDGAMRGRILEANISVGEKKYPKVKRVVRPGAFFSSMFPIWLSKNLPLLKEGQATSFTGVIEDNLEQGFRSESGIVRLEKPDEIAKKTKTKKLTVKFKGGKTIWWVFPTGAAFAIEIPSQKLVVKYSAQQPTDQFLATPSP